MAVYRRGRAGFEVGFAPSIRALALLREDQKRACWVWMELRRAFPSLSSRLGGVSKGACWDRSLALPLRYALLRYSGRTRGGLEVGVRGIEFGFAPSIRALALLRED